VASLDSLRDGGGCLIWYLKIIGYEHILMDKIGQGNRINAIFYKEFRVLLDNIGLNALPLPRGRSEVRILSGTPIKSMGYVNRANKPFEI
jgi:hypothetical protein